MTDREYWDAVAGDSDRIEAEVYSDLDLGECLEAILPSLPLDTPGLIVDLGCGVGRLTVPIAQRYTLGVVAGVDVSFEMVTRAQHNAAWEGVSNVYFHAWNGQDLGLFEDWEVAGAYSMTMFQHIPSDAQRAYVREVYRVLKPGGVFRYQWVIEGESGPMSHPVPTHRMAAWLMSVGFSASLTHGLIEPSWGWATATK